MQPWLTLNRAFAFVRGARVSLVSFVSLVAFLTILLAGSPARASSGPPVAVEVLPGAPEIEPAALREAVARELDAQVVEPGDAAQPAFTLLVSIDRARHELVVERRDATTGVSRRVPLPADPGETLRVTVFLIGNLARNEADDLVRSLRPPPPPPAAKPEVTPLGPPPDEPALAPAPPPQIWLGIDASFDLYFLRSGSNVCAGNPDYLCTDTTGADYAPVNAQSSGSVAGGLQYGTTRALLTLERAWTGNWLLGARLGLAYGTYDGSRLAKWPLHVEARVSYVFGEAPLHSAGVAPYVMTSAGVAPWSAGVGTTVVEKTSTGATSPVAAKAWEVGGSVFVSAGAGVRWAPHPRFAITAGPRLNVSFVTGTTLYSLSTEVGVAYGF